MFSEFNPVPCGAASLAQVHEARLASNGQRVAVKIQHPHVKARSHVDIATMELLVRVASWLFPDLHLMWLVDETKRNLPKELDFFQEALNADRMRSMFTHMPYIVVPKIHYALTTDMVLTMDFEQGAQINDVEAFEREKLDRHGICKKLGRLYSEMIFVRGFVHCDPHPGNVLVRRNPRNGEEEIVLLDHGLYSVGSFKSSHQSIQVEQFQINSEPARAAPNRLLPAVARPDEAGQGRDSPPLHQDGRRAVLRPVRMHRRRPLVGVRHEGNHQDQVQLRGEGPHPAICHHSHPTDLHSARLDAQAHAAGAEDQRPD